MANAHAARARTFSTASKVVKSGVQDADADDDADVINADADGADTGAYAVAANDMLSACVRNADISCGDDIAVDVDANRASVAGQHTTADGVAFAIGIWGTLPLPLPLVPPLR